MAQGIGRRAISEALNNIFGKTPNTTPAGVLFVALFVGDPGDEKVSKS